jgi:uncharacterized protein (DUF983 family)
MSDVQNTEGQAGIFRSAFFALCPCCGAKGLFTGPVKLSQKCNSCGLDYSAFNVGDGPAAFLTMAVGAIVILLAMLVETLLHPPFWVHVLIWVPVTAGLTIGLLRMAKAALLISEYRNKAVEGIMDESE